MSGFADFIPEMLEAFGPVTLRRMFGGHGVYHQGLMFALVADDTLYLKTDAGNLAEFEALGLEAFRYTDRHGRTAQLSYRRAPDDMLDDRDMAAHWARSAYRAALRARAAARPRRANPAKGWNPP